jgi:ubiquinone/menaquinone biosynthesis C-methylase UbiE
LLSYIELPSNTNVLDLGCATRRLLDGLGNNLSEIRGTGLDLSIQILRVARQKNRHRPCLIYVEGNAE